MPCSLNNHIFGLWLCSLFTCIISTPKLGDTLTPSVSCSLYSLIAGESCRSQYFPLRREHWKVTASFQIVGKKPEEQLAQLQPLLHQQRQIWRATTPWDPGRQKSFIPVENVRVEIPQGWFSFLSACYRNMARVDFLKKGIFVQKYWRKKY